MHSFRPPHQSRDCFQRLCVCPNPSERSIFAQMTVGLKMLYSSIDDKASKNQINKSLCLNSSFKEDKFKPVIGALLAGRYKVIANVGEGQSSVMVQAEDTYHPKQRYVAIKILHKSYANLGPQEASCLLHLRNSDVYNVSNIAHFLNMFSIGNHFCIVFKFLLPKPIYKYFQMFPFRNKVERLNSLRRIAFQVTQSLIVLSSLNIIHADIKPENILFTDASRKNVKLIDLGNAIYCVHKEMSLYFDSFELQTVFYRAPEVMFGLPFGYQIDMWSLACVLAELYLGEPLFLATSKEEILEQMHSLLGPLPLSPYQEGKYFTDFKKYVSRNSLVHGHCEKVVNVMKKLKSTDFIFADFVTKLLAFDPCLRLTPMDAIRHPFLAPECASGFISSHGYFSRAESGYPSVLLTSETYPYHPFIDEKIKKLHFSDLELLRVGTCRKPASNNVLKVLPLNYQADHSEDVDESSLNTDDQSEGPFNESCYALNARVSRSDHCRRDPSRKRQRTFFIRGQSKAPRTSQEGLSCSLASTEKYLDNNAVFDDGRTGYSCEKSNKIIAKRGRKRSALYCRPSWLKATKKRRLTINTKTKSKCTGAKITSPVCSGSVDKEYAASFSQLEKGSNGESGDNHDGIAHDASTASCSRKQPFSSIEKFSLNHKAAIEEYNGREEGKKTFLQSSSKSKTNFKDTNTDVQILDEVSNVGADTSNLDSFFHPFADDDVDMSRSQAEEYCKDSILEGEESEEQNCSSEEDYDVVLI